VNKIPDDQRLQPGEYKFRFNIAAPPIFAMSFGERVQATRALLTVTFTVTHTATPVQFHNYFDVARSKDITQTAIASVQLGSQQASIVLAKNEAGEINISLVKSPA
jgi:hypothetical protein